MIGKGNEKAPDAGAPRATKSSFQYMKYNQCQTRWLIYYCSVLPFGKIGGILFKTKTTAKPTTVVTPIAMAAVS